MSPPQRTRSIAKTARMARVVLARAIVAVAASGCGDGDMLGDSGVDGGALDGGGVEPAPPAPPEAPTLVPCPTGWLEVTSAEGDVTCEPWHEPTLAPCADHEARFPGDPGCARIGTACPADGVPADVPATAIHVRAGATSGDGSRASPFGTVTEALAIASAGDVVAIAVGEYDEAIAPSAGVELVGACVEETLLRSSSPSLAAGVITPTGEGVAIRNLGIGASERVGLWVAGRGTSVIVSDIAIHDARVAGIDVEGGARLEADRIAVRRTQPTSTGLYGRGLTVESNAHAIVRRAIFEGSYEFGVIALHTGTMLDIEEAHVADVEPAPSGTWGVGLGVVEGAVATVAALVVERTSAAGVLVADEGSRATLDHAVVRDVRGVAGLPMMTFGRGLNAQASAELEARRTLVERVHDIGVVAGALAHVTLADVVVRDVLRRPDGAFGRALSAEEGTIEGARILVRRVHDTAIVGSGGSAVVRVADVRVSEVGPWESGILGRGIGMQTGATGTLERAHVSGVFEIGVSAIGEGTSLSGTDLAVLNVSSREADGRHGRGVLVQQGAALTFARTDIQSTHDVGAAAILDAALTLDDARIETVAAAECEATGACSSLGGHGLGVYEGSTARLTTFVIADAALCGVHVANDGVAMLADGEVRASAIGACVQSGAQPLGGLEDGVRYVGNERNLEATTLPVPDPLAASE